jgi:hypothetical protein
MAWKSLSNNHARLREEAIRKGDARALAAQTLYRAQIDRAANIPELQEALAAANKEAVEATNALALFEVRKAANERQQEPPVVKVESRSAYPSIEELTAQAQASLLDFLYADLNLSSAMLEIATVAIDHEHRKSAMEKVRRAIEVVRTLQALVEDPATRKTIQERANELARQLHACEVAAAQT